MLGQVAKGVLAADLKVGMEMQLEIDHAQRDRRSRNGSSWSTSGRRHEQPIGDLDSPSSGSGMHPWGKWGRDFTEYGMVAARGRARRRRARLDRRPVRRRGGHDPQRLPGLHRRGDVRPEARLERRPGDLELRRLRLGRAGTPIGARPDPRRVLRRGAGDRRRHDAEGVLRPGRRRATARRPRLAAVPPPRRDQPGVLRALRPPSDGPVRRDRRGLRPGEGEELAPRPAQPERPVPQAERGRGRPQLARSSSDPLRLLDICATSRRGGGDDRRAAWSSPSGTSARSHGAVPGQGGLDRHPDLSADDRSSCPTSPPTRAPSSPRPSGGTRTRSPGPPTKRPGIGPDDLSLAEVYDLSTALELDWYEHIGLCARARPRTCCAAARRRSVAGSRSTRAAGSPAFGEAIPAQAIAQVCELTWQLRGQAGARQVDGATVGITANQGLFGHGSSVIVAR